MAITVNTNVSALVAQRHLSKAQAKCSINLWSDCRQALALIVMDDAAGFTNL